MSERYTLRIARTAEKDLQRFDIKPTTKVNCRIQSGNGFHLFCLWHG
jgi:hypothetical protein